MALDQVKLKKLEDKKNALFADFMAAEKEKDESIAKGGHGNYTCDPEVWKRYWEIRNKWENANKQYNSYKYSEERRAEREARKQEKLAKIEAKKNKVETKKRKEQELHDQTFRAPIALVVEPYRKAAVDAAIEKANEVVANLAKQLEQNGWDLNKVAPSPSTRGNITRKEYRAQQERFNFVVSLVKSTSNKYYMKNEPYIVEMCPKKIEFYMHCTKLEAEAQYTKYIYKLTSRIGELVSAELDPNFRNLWYESHLIITRKDGTKETWKTKQIINVSCLGKLFNQWPTRKVG